MVPTLMLVIGLPAGCASQTTSDSVGDSLVARASIPHADNTPRPLTGRVRLGYFPNLTHAPAIVGLDSGYFTSALGPGVTLSTTTFAAGPAAVEALWSGAIDIAYLGPNPAINGFVRSDGAALRIIAGSTSGGASLVVRSTINSAADLTGRRLATPQLGGTQDLALRHWLKLHGMPTTFEGGGKVSVLPQSNAQTLETFRSGAIDGAWVPEPWASRLVLEGGGHVLVDERDLWPERSFATTVVVVRASFLRDHSDLVEAILTAHVAAIDALAADPTRGRQLVNTALERLTGRRLADATMNRAWANLRFTLDPELASLRVVAEHAVDLGALPSADLDGIEDLSLLNAILSNDARER